MFRAKCFGSDVRYFVDGSTSFVFLDTDVSSTYSLIILFGEKGLNWSQSGVSSIDFKLLDF